MIPHCRAFYSPLCLASLPSILYNCLIGGTSHDPTTNITRCAVCCHLVDRVSRRSVAGQRGPRSETGRQPAKRLVGGRTVSEPRRLGRRFAVHGPDGLAVPFGPRAGHAGPQRDHHRHVSGDGDLPRVGPHPRLGCPLARPRQTGPVPGPGRRQGAARDFRRRGRRVALAARRHRRDICQASESRLARSDRLRGPLRRDPLLAGQPDAAQQGAGDDGLPPQAARPAREAQGGRPVRSGGGWGGHGRHLCGVIGRPARSRRGPGARSAGFGRQQQFGSPRLAQRCAKHEALAPRGRHRGRTGAENSRVPRHRGDLRGPATPRRGAGGKNTSS